VDDIENRRLGSGRHIIGMEDERIGR